MATSRTQEKNTEKETKPVRSKRTQKAVAPKKVVVREDNELRAQEVQEKSVIANIEMLYNTIKELKRLEKYQQIARVNVAQEENFARLASLNEELAKEIIAKYRVDDNGINTARKSNREREILDDTDNMLALINATENEVSEETVEETVEYGVYGKKEDVEKVKVEEFEYFDSEIPEGYDILDLPSKGECYLSKKSKIAIAPLTATDENFITSPALYRDGLIIDCLLKRKVVDKSIDVESLVSGDVDAITYYLRVNSYGPEFPARFTDSDTNTTFETIIDLTQIKPKEFTLKGDENGWFDFETPLKKDKIKFRFLTRRDEKKLEKLFEIENKDTKANTLREMAKYLDTMLDEKIELLDQDDVFKLEDAVPVMENWAKAIDEKEGLPVNRMVTNRLELEVMAVNGNTDRKFIKKYVRSMVAKDSLALRRYILNNTPGMDFSVKIEKPESLGGGYINTFLEWSDNVFLSIT